MKGMTMADQQSKKGSRQGRNAKKCESYRTRKGGTGHHKHVGRRSRPLSITGICSGIPMQGELGKHHKPYPNGYVAPKPPPRLVTA